MGLVLVLAVAATLVHVSSAQSCVCPRSKTYYLKHYDELGCTPTNDKTTCCPTAYNCSTAMNRPAGKCRFKQMDYIVGQPLDPNAGLPCLNCRCTNTTLGLGFQCGILRCPKLRLPTNCSELYEFNSCCATGVNCKTNSTAPTPDFTCKLGNKTYYQGEMMPSDHPCKSCLCQKGFNGTMNGPWCRINSCGLELNYHETFKRGCVPIYLKDASACCPIRWRCPSDKDYVIVATPPKPATTAKPNPATVALMTTMGTNSTNLPPMTTAQPMTPMVASMGSMTAAQMTAKPMTPMVASMGSMTAAPMTAKPMTPMVASMGSMTAAPMTAKPMTPMVASMGSMTAAPMTTKMGQNRRRRFALLDDMKPTMAQITTPMPSTMVTPTKPAGNVTAPAMMCMFGKLHLNVNDELSSTSNKCVLCTCSVPPYVSCLLEPRCSPWQ